MNNYPRIWSLDGLLDFIHTSGMKVQCNKTKQWVPCRPVGYPSLVSRIKTAWLVFTGKADAIVWPGEQ